MPDLPLKEKEEKYEDFFNVVYRAFEKVREVSKTSVDRFYSIGGYKICLRFANPTLIPYITPALDHMLCEAVPSPALTICICDSVSTRTALPFLGPLNEYLNDEEVERRTGQKTIYMNLDRRVTNPSKINMLNTRSNIAIHWVRDASIFHYEEIALPLKMIFHWWMHGHGCQIVHGAAVGLPEGGVLLAGKAGAGKSTSTLACLSSDLLHVGDDWIVLQREPTPLAHTLYNSVMLNPAHLMKMFPQLLPMVSNARQLDTEKAIVFLKDHYKHKLISNFPIKAALLVNITDLEQTTIKKASCVDILNGLIPHTFYWDSRYGTGQGNLENLHQIVKQLPVFTLEAGRNLSGHPREILDLLSKLRIMVA